jgi:hypothetical protein
MPAIVTSTYTALYLDYLPLVVEEKTLGYSYRIGDYPFNLVVIISTHLKSDA